MLQQIAKLGNPSSKEGSPVQEARVCESKPHVTRRVPNRMRGCRVLLCVHRIQYYCGNSSLQHPPNSSKTPAYFHKHQKIGKYETRRTNLGHTKNRSACQFFFPVSAPIRFSLSITVAKFRFKIQKGGNNADRMQICFMAGPTFSRRGSAMRVRPQWSVHGMGVLVGGWMMDG